jgi:hypothetical protein
MYTANQTGIFCTSKCKSQYVITHHPTYIGLYTNSENAEPQKQLENMQGQHNRILNYQVET